ncbi:MAG: hypothetical protein MJ252_29540 [archaeon]|nr:hypothetical protein [archaeon]
MLDNKYWDINDILMSEELVNCQLLKECSFLKDLVQNEEEDDDAQFEENEELKLPITFACDLAEHSFINIQLPVFLSEGFYNILQADPTVPDMSGNESYFYEKTLLLMPYVLEEENLEDEEGLDLRKWKGCLTNTIFCRFLFFFKNSQNVQLINTNVSKSSSHTEQVFFEYMVKLNNNLKYFKENYSNSNRLLAEKTQAKENRMKFKKSKGGQIV